jgi:hypothetical protein
MGTRVCCGVSVARDAAPLTRAGSNAGVAVAVAVAPEVTVPQYTPPVRCPAPSPHPCPFACLTTIVPVLAARPEAARGADTTTHVVLVNSRAGTHAGGARG